MEHVYITPSLPSVLGAVQFNGVFAWVLIWYEVAMYIDESKIIKCWWSQLGWCRVTMMVFEIRRKFMFIFILRLLLTGPAGDKPDAASPDIG